jgi:hypothetical protein
LIVFFYKKDCLARGLGVAAMDGLKICNAQVGKLVTRLGKSLEKTSIVEKDKKMLVSIFHWVAIHNDTIDGLGRLSHDYQSKTHFLFHLPPCACLCTTHQPSSFLLQA